MTSMSAVQHQATYHPPQVHSGAPPLSLHLTVNYGSTTSAGSSATVLAVPTSARHHRPRSASSPSPQYLQPSTPTKPAMKKKKTPPEKEVSKVKGSLASPASSTSSASSHRKQSTNVKSSASSSEHKLDKSSKSKTSSSEHKLDKSSKSKTSSSSSVGHKVDKSSKSKASSSSSTSTNHKQEKPSESKPSTSPSKLVDQKHDKSTKCKPSSSSLTISDQKHEKSCISKPSSTSSLSTGLSPHQKQRSPSPSATQQLLSVTPTPAPSISSITPWQASGEDKPMYAGSDIPSQDLPEDYTVPEPEIMSPDVSRYTPLPGYEDTGYYADGAAPPIPPPRYDEVTRQHQPTEQFSSVAPITVNQAREALISHVAAHCCYGRGAARQMDICKITSSCALQYTLESFVETRSTSWQQEPYKGQPVDTTLNGVPPTAWALTAKPEQLFSNEVQQYNVPHTDSVMWELWIESLTIYCCQISGLVEPSCEATPECSLSKKQCHACTAQGFNRCHNCCGRGFKRCVSCNGSGRSWETDAHGHRHHKPCLGCSGSGRKRCFTCAGDGRIVCKTCQGFRQLKCFIKLTVNFTNNLSEHVIERSDLPNYLVKKAVGSNIFQQTLPRVWPVTSYPDQDLCINSQRLVNDHGHKFNHSRVLMQRHVLRAVPVSECTYKWKDKKERFWVYGNERAVHVPSYPQKCCWGCVVM